MTQKIDKVGIRINLMGGNDSIASKMQDTLCHVFPNISVKYLKQSDEKIPSDISVIDTTSIEKSSISEILDSLDTTPIIVIAKDARELDSLRGILNGKTSIISPSEMEGMGLIRSVHHLIERQKLSDQLKKASEHIKKLSTRDELTGFHNNSHFHDVLSGEVKKANRYGRHLGLIIISIKNLSLINKSLGHNEGDRVMSKSAEVIKKIIRDVDIPARYGDNEFAIILPESDENGTRIVAERILGILSRLEINTGKQNITIKTSSGISALTGHMHNKEDLLRNALAALIEAKKSNKDIICASDDIGGKNRKENRQLMDALENKLKKLSDSTYSSYFDSVIKTFNEIPLSKKIIMPHSERVAFLAKRLAEAYGLEQSSINTIYRAGILHDVGKLVMDMSILLKPEALSLAEQKLMQKHPIFAVQMLGDTPFLHDEAMSILHHHERFDGEGYPEGLSREAIPIGARCLAISEAWDIMTTSQPYRETPLMLDEAIEEIRNGSEEQFDPDISRCFINLIVG